LHQTTVRPDVIVTSAPPHTKAVIRNKAFSQIKTSTSHPRAWLHVEAPLQCGLHAARRASI